MVWLEWSRDVAWRKVFESRHTMMCFEAGIALYVLQCDILWVQDFCPRAYLVAPDFRRRGCGIVDLGPRIWSGVMVRRDRGRRFLKSGYVPVHPGDPCDLGWDSNISSISAAVARESRCPSYLRSFVYISMIV